MTTFSTVILTIHGGSAASEVRARQLASELNRGAAGARVEVATLTGGNASIERVLQRSRGPATVVPLALARGELFGRRLDLRIAGARRGDVRVAPALGSWPEVRRRYRRDALRFDRVARADGSVDALVLWHGSRRNAAGRAVARSYVHELEATGRFHAVVGVDIVEPGRAAAPLEDSDSVVVVPLLFGGGNHDAHDAGAVTRRLRGRLFHLPTLSTLPGLDELVAAKLDELEGRSTAVKGGAA